MAQEQNDAVLILSTAHKIVIGAMLIFIFIIGIIAEIFGNDSNTPKMNGITMMKLKEAASEDESDECNDPDYECSEKEQLAGNPGIGNL